MVRKHYNETYSAFKVFCIGSIFEESYKAKVEPDLSTSLAIFRQHCQRQAPTDKYEQCLGRVDARYDALNEVLWYPHVGLVRS